MQNLLAYWCGALLAGLFYLLVPLIVLHSTPASDSFAKGVAGSDPNPVVQHAITGVGVFLLVVAAVMAVRSFARSPSGGGPLPDRPGAAGTTTTTLDPSTLPFLSRLMRPATEVPPQDGSWTRRLLGRAREAWQNGSPWIAFAIGLMVLPADGIFLALALIVASGATVGMQLAAAVVFVIIVLSVEEVILISNVLIPEKTQAALRWLHECAVVHRQKFMAAILALVGTSLIIQGTGIL